MTRQAFNEGFRVIRANPTPVLIWGLVLLIGGVLPVAMVAASGVPQILELMRMEPAATAAGEAPDVEGQILTLLAFAALVSLPARAVVAGAVFRAVFEPRDKRFAYLRLGRQELWLGVAMLVVRLILLIVGAALMVAAASFVGFVDSLLEGAAIQAGASMLVTALTAAAALAAFVWVWLRLSLALPLTFAERGLRPFEMWRVTHGLPSAVFGLAAGLGVVLVVMWGLLVGVDLLLLAAADWEITDRAKWGALFAEPYPVWLSYLAPGMAMLALLACLMGAAASAIWLAPWAHTLLQLSGVTPGELSEKVRRPRHGLVRDPCRWSDPLAR